MSTYRELVFMVLDELKLSTDDSTINENHIIFLLDKYRAAILQQHYANIKKEIPESNYQTICLNLTPIPEDSEERFYLKSEESIPYMLNIGTPQVYPIDYYEGTITYVSKERMKYIGYNKYLQNIIYCSLGPDNHLYFKCSNHQLLYLEKVNMVGLFQNPSEAAFIKCSNHNNINNILDAVFPLEESLIPQLISTIVNDIFRAVFNPEDATNNANDDFADMMAYIRRNIKSNVLEGTNKE
jgi:hypothetical protein